MDWHKKSSLLLVFNMVLWITQSEILQLDLPFPLIRFPHPSNASITVELYSAQLLVLFIGLANIISFYYLLNAIAEWKIQKMQQVMFLVSTYLVISGTSIHTICVIVQKQILPSNDIYHLVDFFHEYVAHNMSMSGLYLTLLTIMWVEHKHMIHCIQMKKEKDGNLNKMVSDYIWTGMKWIFPIILGLNFPIFSSRTSTQLVTLSFFLLVFCLVFITFRRLLSLGVAYKSLFRVCESETVTMSCFFKVSMVGLPTIMVFLYL